MSDQERYWPEMERLRNGSEPQYLEKDLMNLAMGYICKQNRIDLLHPLLTLTVLHS